MITLAREVGNESSQPHIRSAASIAMKNALTARVRKHLPSSIDHALMRFPPQDANRAQEYSSRWLALPVDGRTEIKNHILATLASQVTTAGAQAAQVVAAIAAVELPAGQWEDLIQILLGFVNDSRPNLKISTLTAIGFICETIVSGPLTAACSFLSLTFVL